MRWRDAPLKEFHCLPRRWHSRATKFTYGEAWSSVYLGFAKLFDNDRDGLLIMLGALSHLRASTNIAR